MTSVMTRPTMRSASSSRPQRPTPPLESPVVLVVDSDFSYREALASGLAQSGFAVQTAGEGREALEVFNWIQPDMVLLDMDLPDLSGIDLFRQMRAVRPVPVIVVSARKTELDVVLSLEQGASDFVGKPFRLRELVARMRAILRRGQPSVPTEEHLRVGPVHLDLGSRQATVHDREIELSRREFDLLALFMSRPNEVITRRACIEQLWWNQDLSDTRTLDTHVKRLRRKIESDPAKPRHLLTMRGVGFRVAS
jgi:two-component system, OmpR family, response regulator RegX3